MHSTWQRSLVGSILALTLATSSALAQQAGEPVISIIIDDIGYRVHDDLRALGLPGQVAFAIMPHAPYSRKMSVLASTLGKDVILHMPMQATAEDKNRFLGPGALTLEMTEKQFVDTLEISLQSVPQAVAVNNHMGSLITQHPGHMSWLMKSLKNRKKFYIDSVTSNHSVATDLAREYRVPVLSRDVFLDNIQREDDIQQQFSELVRIARKRGHAIAIGHPHPVTIDVLSSNLANLKRFGVQLISPSRMLSTRVNVHGKNKQLISAGQQAEK